MVYSGTYFLPEGIGHDSTKWGWEHQLEQLSSKYICSRLISRLIQLLLVQVVQVTFLEPHIYLQINVCCIESAAPKRQYMFSAQCGFLRSIS